MSQADRVIEAFRLILVLMIGGYVLFNVAKILVTSL